MNNMLVKSVVDYTPASRVVRAEAKKLYGDRAFVFNDRLKTSGGRSIKLWGAGKSFYTPIKRKLERMGYKVTLKNLGKNRIRSDGQDCYRIHVL